MLTQLIGNFPALSASSPVSLPLKSLMPRHAVHALQMRVQFTATTSGAGPATAITDTEVDTLRNLIVTRVRLYGGLIGEPINISTTNLRSIYISRAARDNEALIPATNTKISGATLAGATGYVVNIDVTIPFFDKRCRLDPDWFAPCSDTLRHESFLEITAGTLAASGTTIGGFTITPSVISVELVALLTDAHGSYLAPVNAMRDMTQPSNTMTLEPGLFLNIFDTRNTVGSGLYNPTYVVSKDGKVVAQNVTGQSLALAWYKSVAPPGAYDLPARIGPIVWMGDGYSEDDLKPSLANHQIFVPTGYTSGTTIYDMLRGVSADQEARQAQNEGLSKYVAPLRTVLGASDGDIDHGKVALFKPRWIRHA